MTPKLIQLTNLTRVMLVIMPEEAINVFFHDKYIVYETFGVHKLYLPQGNWQLIGKLSELTEEQVQPLVFRAKTGRYRNYTHVDFPGEDMGTGILNALALNNKETALESFHSAIEAEGYFVINPLGSEPTPENTPNYAYSIHARQWESAQSKTLPANTLILEMI